jgi:hypothetical protein
MNNPPGICRYCRCTETNACRLPNGDTCVWLTADRDVCSAPACIRQYRVDMDRAGEAARRAQRRPTPADIHARMQEERRARVRRARQAARARRRT